MFLHIMIVVGIYRHNICFIHIDVMIFYRCAGVDDDIYRPCFQCEDITSRSGVPDYAYTYIDRQSGEAFQVTQPSRRVICRGPVAGRGRRCKLRISRAMQFRQTRYGSVLRFVQAERYLSTDDLDIVRYYKKLRYFLLRLRY